MPAPMITPGYLLQAGRYNNGLDPSGFDPSNTVDPMQAIAVQQQYAKSLLQYQQELQNPRLALPQQFGAALGQMAQGLLPQSMLPQQPAQPQGQQGPSTSQGQALHQAAIQMMQQNPGMSMPEALYKSADQMDSSGQYDNDPQMARVLDHARDWSKKQGYNPTLESEEKTKAQFKSAEQFQNLKTGESVQAQPGTPLYKHIIESGDYKKVGDAPQIAVGQRQQMLKNGMYVESQWDGQKWAPVAKSEKPIDRSMVTTGAPDQMGAAWGNPGAPKSWGDASAAEATKELTNRTAAVQKFQDTANQLSQVITPNSIGNPGEVNEKINNIRATANTLASQLGYKIGDAKFPATANTGKLVDGFRKYGVDSEKVKSLMLTAALQMEAIEGPKDSTDANRKFSIEKRMQMLGEDSSDPEALLQTIKMQSEKAARDLHIEYQNKAPVAHMDEPEWLKQQVHGPSTASDQYKSPEDVRAAFQAKRITREQAKQILKDHHGFT